MVNHSKDTSLMKRIVIAFAAAATIATPALACSGSKTADAATTRHVTETVSADIVDTAKAAGSFNTLLAAADAAGLVGALKSDGPLTVFAPTDAAFAALPEGTIESLLLPENQDQLAAILKLHVIAGSAVTSDQLAGKQLTAQTLNGAVSIDGTNGVTVNGATVVAADVEASNGVIHVIDSVLLPAG